eukprot:GDKI01035841.1.p1 GENE.GDKI01035841.1~~GDKI01035841.1.p1  ORF type:complete len:121 (-),score=25.51 GDKI01035841.1:277-639(-)
MKVSFFVAIAAIAACVPKVQGLEDFMSLIEASHATDETHTHTLTTELARKGDRCCANWSRQGSSVYYECTTTSAAYFHWCECKTVEEGCDHEDLGVCEYWWGAGHMDVCRPGEKNEFVDH